MGTTAEKLTYLNGTKRLLRRRLNSLGANITLDTKFRDYLVWLNRFYNAATSSVKFELLGDTTQKAENQSANILPLYDDEIVTDGVTVTISNGGKITVNGTPTRNLYIKLTNGIDVSYDNYNNNWTKEFVLIFNQEFYQQICNGTGTQPASNTAKISFNYGTGYTKDLRSAVDPNKTEGKTIFSSDYNYDYLRCSYLYLKQGELFNFSFYLQFCYTNETQWVANNDSLPPSPTNNKITKGITNKNLFKIKQMYNINTSSYENISNGINTQRISSDHTLEVKYNYISQEISFVGDWSQEHNVQYPCFKINGLEAGIYNISINKPLPIYMILNLSINDNEKYLQPNMTSQQFAIQEQDAVNDLEIKVVPNTTHYGGETFSYNDTFKIQIEKSNKPSEWIYNIENEIELYEIGDYKDSIYLKNGKFYYEKNIGKVTLDGSENWGYISNNQVFWLAFTGFKQSGLVCMSNYYEGQTNVTVTGLVQNNHITFRDTDVVSNQSMYIKDT